MAVPSSARRWRAEVSVFGVAAADSTFAVAASGEPRAKRGSAGAAVATVTAARQLSGGRGSAGTMRITAERRTVVVRPRVASFVAVGPWAWLSGHGHGHALRVRSEASGACRGSDAAAVAQRERGRSLSACGGLAIARLTHRSKKQA